MEILINELPTKKARIPKGSYIEALVQHEAKGKAEGKAEGEAEGKTKGKKEVLISLMEEFPELTDTRLSKLAKVELQIIKELREELLRKKR